MILQKMTAASVLTIVAGKTGTGDGCRGCTVILASVCNDIHRDS